VAEIVGHIERVVVDEYEDPDLPEHGFNVYSGTAPGGMSYPPRDHYKCWPDYRENDEALAEARGALPSRFRSRYTLVFERFRGPDDIRVHYDHDWERDMKYMHSLTTKPEPDAVIDLLLHLDIEDEL
jgi:hypothetical protein